ncbi:LysR family transcriptional regulator [Deinococcus roseus]|uniref:LysR family transcriptional regulator n=1 Tax=Deinococcus roseus TaxID=392414 RepID=A0ABQ2CYL4_9DEIO|nr:LysR family transcriptional regulator [Deinococcus roseus]GGJ33718.1 LysR family transcriptional regulator [Deinococcus roseus]
MKLHQLKALIAVADTGSLSRAASALQMSQSSVSEAVQALEKHHQSRLLLRGPLGSQLTVLGEQVVRHARIALQALESIDQEVALSRGSLQGTLRISLFRSISSQIMPALMAHLKKHHPDLQLELLECTICYEENLLAPLHQGKADLAFVPNGEAEGFTSWPLFQDPFVVLLPQHWQLSRPVDPADLQGKTLIVTRDCDCTLRIQGYLTTHQITPAEIIWVQDDLTMYNMVKEGIGACLTARMALDYLPANTAVAPLVFPMHRDIRLVVRQDGLDVPAIREVVQVLQTLLPDVQP